MPLPLPPSDPAAALGHARAKLRVLRHVRDELHVTDPRALAQLDADESDVRHVIEIQLTLLDVEILDVRRVIGSLLAELDGVTS
jgi:ferredoxin-fold anticodon binding domain-containing protein